MPVQDPILVFVVLLTAILAAPLLAERLRIPDLILLIVFGALLGPSGLDILEMSPAIGLFSAVGMLYIMFLAGLEIDLHLFMQTRLRGIEFGLLTFAIPQIIGTLTAHYVLGLNWSASVLLGSTFASHTLLAYPIASRLGISKTEPVAVSVGATIITDTLALLVLAVIADMARGVGLGPLFWVGIILGMFALIVLTWFGIPRLSGWFFRRVTENGSAQFVFVLVTVCVCAYLSHFARMEPIIGAFLAGAAFNRLIPGQSPLMNRILFVGHTLFIPLFLISVGMLVNVRMIASDPRNWFVGVVLVLCVASCKYAAAMIARRRFGYSAEAGKVMFGLTVPQAAATLAAVLIGYELRIFDDIVLNGVIATIVVSCPLGSWAVDRYGRKLAQRQVVRPAARAEERIMVLVSKPSSAGKLLELVFLLRDKTLPGSIYPLTIVREQGELGRAVANGENLLAWCMSQGASAEMQVNPSLRVAVNVTDGVLHAAAELHPTTIVAGWAGEQKTTFMLFGSFVGRMVRHCPARLMFCRLPHPLNTVQRLLVVFPPLAERRLDLPESVELSKRLAHQIGAELRVYLTGDAQELIARIESTRPECRLAVVQTGIWSETRSRLLNDIRQGDMALVLVERSGGSLWTPTLDRLPDLMVSRFPETNLVTIYPPLPVDETTAAEIAEPETPFPNMAAFEFDTRRSFEENLRDMVRQAFPNDLNGATDAFGLLMSSAESFPAELAPGLVLLHAHCGAMERPLLLVGFGTDVRWPFGNLASSPRIVLGLLTSKTQLPQVHLKTLAAVARRFHTRSVADQIQAASSAREIRNILAGQE